MRVKTPRGAGERVGMEVWTVENEGQRMRSVGYSTSRVWDLGV